MAAEREIRSLRAFNHPMIIGIVDLVKDYHNFPHIIMEDRNSAVKKIIISNIECDEERTI